MERNLKAVVCKAIDDNASELNNISQKLWQHPELSHKEFLAHEIITSFLEDEGFKVSRKTPLETSFIARYGNPEGLKIGVLCEYDALPGLGHACGHNLIAEAGIGAALGIKAAMELQTDVKMEVIAYGTPAEEADYDNGKIVMIKEKVFDEADVCMMSHPTPFEIPVPMWLAVFTIKIIFIGKASHAAAAPWEGVNALDAAVSCYNSVSMLRQQMKPTSCVHCTIVHGGDKPNIIPERAELCYYIRGLTDEDTLELKDKVVNCAKGAALATGCTVEFPTVANTFMSAVKTNATLIKLYINNAKSLGVKFNDDEYITTVTASTDMGNVSQIKPSIHPLFKIKTDGACHTHKFTEATCAYENQLPTLNSAKSMAMTAIDILCKPELMSQIRMDFYQ